MGREVVLMCTYCPLSIFKKEIIDFGGVFFEKIEL